MSIRVDVAKSWRKEFKEVASTIKHVFSDSSLRDVKARVLVVSDGTDSQGMESYDLVLRIWWNDSSEALALTSSNQNPAREVNVTFFSDVQNEMIGHSIHSIHVPFVFARPTRPSWIVNRNLVFLGEVSSSLPHMDLDQVVLENLSDACNELSDNVLAGRIATAEVSSVLKNLLAFEIDPTTNSNCVWLVRNLVRLKAIVNLRKLYSSRLSIRGDDWKNLGLPGKRTMHSQVLRRHLYSSSITCLDFGSKSTSDMLYPRTAEILSSGGLLAQLNPLAPKSGIGPTVDSCIAASLPDLEQICDQRLAMKTRELLDLRHTLHDEYCSYRSRRIELMVRQLSTLLPS